MPIVKKNEPMPERPVIILIFGDPGVGKTSLANTSDTPLLNDFDRGADRAIYRQDTLVIPSWEEVQKQESAGLFKNYKTIIIDTAKSALDDILMPYIVKKDVKYQKNKMAAYGAMGDEFKLFVNNRRTESADIVILAHAKDDKEGEVMRKYPDITGGSYALLLRIADQVGFMSMRNNKRTLLFDPTDTTVGKNVARIPLIEVPDETDPKFKTFMAELLLKTRKSIASLDEKQVEALKTSESLQIRLEACTTPEELTKLLQESKALPDYLRLPLQTLISKSAKANNWVANKEKGQFEVPAPAAGSVNPAPVAKSETVTPTSNPTPAADVKPSAKDDNDGFNKMMEPIDLKGKIDVIQKLGIAVGSDGLVYGEYAFTFEELEEMSEDDFATLVGKLKMIIKKKVAAEKKNKTA